MTTRKRRQFTAEFKSDAVKLVRTGGQSISQVARNLDLTETALREWVRRAEIEAGDGPPGALIQAEREELIRVRRRLKVTIRSTPARIAAARTCRSSGAGRRHR